MHPENHTPLLSAVAPRPGEKNAGKSASPRIAIVHQNRVQADALRLACAEVFPTAEMNLHPRGNPALLALRQQPADILLVGLTFEDIDGIELLKQVCDAPLASRILIVSEHWDEHVLLSLRTVLFTGAVDLTTECIDTIKQILRHVAHGHGYISPTLRRYLIDELPSGLSTNELTVTELRVLRVIGDGSDNHEAALQLGITKATVQTHRRNIMRKLGVATSAKLVREAVRLGVVRIPLLMLFKRPHLEVFPRDNQRAGAGKNRGR